MKTTLKEFTNLDELLDVTEELLRACKQALNSIEEAMLDCSDSDTWQHEYNLLNNAINKTEGR